MRLSMLLNDPPKMVHRSTYLDMRGRKAPESRKEAYKILAKQQEYDTIKSELRKIGLKGKINMKPVEIDLSKVSFDDEHINKERKHNVTLDEAKTFIKNAKFSETVWKGRFERYYSVDGVVYVNKNNLQIRTAFKGDEIKGVTKRAIEVVLCQDLVQIKMRSSAC